MKNIPTFIHFRNDKAATNRGFILHTKNPAWLAEVFSFSSEAAADTFGSEITTAAADTPGKMLIASRTRREVKGRYYVFVVIKLFEKLEFTQPEADRLARIARRMSDWYIYNVLT